MSEATEHAAVCALHPDRAARVDVTGILVCDECFERYQAERRSQQGFNNRLFFQSLVIFQSLVSARHELKPTRI